MTDTTALDQRTADLIDELLWLAQNAQHRLETYALDDSSDILTQLLAGQRDTYAHAAALLAAPHLGEDPADITERIVKALISGGLTSSTGDIAALPSAALRAAAFGTAARPVTPRPSWPLEWLGPKAFAARYGDIPGIDRDFGVRWGTAGNQRLSFRRDPNPHVADDAEHAVDAREGMLYAYDPTWDEYALLHHHVPEDTVSAVFAQALELDKHLPVENFASLLAARHDLHTHVAAAGVTPRAVAGPDVRPSGRGVEL